MFLSCFLFYELNYAARYILGLDNSNQYVFLSWVSLHTLLLIISCIPIDAISFAILYCVEHNFNYC